MTYSLITDPQQWQSALERAARLVRAGDMNGAQAQVDVIVRWLPPDAPYEEAVAWAFQQAAATAGVDGDVAAFEWLWKKALEFWRAWAAGATSGGEGTARMLRISLAEAEYKQERRELVLRLREIAGNSESH